MKRREFLGTGALALSLFGQPSALLSAAASPRPNILFFFPDEHRFDWTSFNPALPDLTPNLRQLAASGVSFTNAITPSPLCAPARACLAAGKEYARCGVAGNGQAYPTDQTTFYTLLKNSGYRVLGCGKFDLDKPGNSWGTDGKHRRDGAPSLLDVWGFSDGIDNEGKQDGVSTYKNNPARRGPYFDYLEHRNLVQAHLVNFKRIDHAPGETPDLPDDAYTDNWIARNGLALLQSVPIGQPWFIQVNFNGPHPPMDVTLSMHENWKGAKFPTAWKNGAPAPGASSPGERRNYAAMINNIDAWLGRYLGEIKKRGELERTVIVYCSDHGEMLGDRGLHGKIQPYQPSAAVPLVVAGPGVAPGQVVDRPVSTMDLAATFLDYAGVARPQEMDSRSLRPCLEHQAPAPRDVVVSALGNWRMVFDGRYKLITGIGDEAPGAPDPATPYILFDLHADPHEDKNIAAQAPDQVKRLEPLLPPPPSAGATPQGKGRKGGKGAKAGKRAKRLQAGE